MYRILYFYGIIACARKRFYVIINGKEDFSYNKMSEFLKEKKEGGGVLLKKISFQKQPMMRKVLYSLIPIVLAAIYFYGFRVLLLMGLNMLVAVLTEKAFSWKIPKKVSEAVLVTAVLYTCTLPPGLPYWISGIGMIFGVVFGKMVFGGFGKNVFNPALVGRAFIYVSFAEQMTIHWNQPATSFPGGFTQYLTQAADAVTQATPLTLFRQSGEMLSFLDALLGKISGSIGETSAVLIVIAAIYLIYTKTASFEIIFSYGLSFVAFSGILYLSGVSGILPPHYGLVTGGVLFGMVFMATDPISAPKEKIAKYCYGILIGFLTVLIRGYALFAGGVMFAILIGNIFAPLLDVFSKFIHQRKKEVA